MNIWEVVTAIATAAQAILVVVTLYVIWLQVKQQTQLAQAANIQSLVEISSPFNLAIIQDREIADLWVNGHKRFDKFDEVDKYRFRNLLIWRLLLHENVFYQYQSRLLDESMFGAWQVDLEDVVKNQNLKVHWEDIRPLFQPAFAMHVDSLVKE